MLLTNCLNYILPPLYFLLVWVYGKAFFASLLPAKRFKTKLLIIVSLVHLSYLISITIIYRHFPVTTVFEIFTSLSFSVSVLYCIIEFTSRRKETGFFIMSIAFFFQLISSIFIKNTTDLPEILQSPYFGIHVSSALIGYAAITIAGAYGLMYLMLYYEMKSSRFGVIYKKLPTLESLERMALTAIKIVVALLGTAICFGIIWLHQVYRGLYYADPKLIGTIVIWIMYVLLVIAERCFFIRGRKIMVFSVAGFLIAIFSMTVINILFSEFHRFF
ncbi:MAG: cytochrome c biogenesis protein CcsA [Bacteroidetes bacterium]|nr:cytochrome c biogenesis protein CcsA [Bacteroidota bacterium]